jgi:hypothetical protein
MEELNFHIGIFPMTFVLIGNYLTMQYQVHKMRERKKE